MPAGSGNTFNIGFKVVVALALIALAVSSFLAFVNGYPALGWFCLGVLGVAICIWILLAGNRDKVVVVILCICTLIVVFAFFSGVQSEWHRLTNQTESETQQKQENPPKYFVLVNEGN